MMKSILASASIVAAAAVLAAAPAQAAPSTEASQSYLVHRIEMHIDDFGDDSDRCLEIYGKLTYRDASGTWHTFWEASDSDYVKACAGNTDYATFVPDESFTVELGSGQAMGFGAHLYDYDPTVLDRDEQLANGHTDIRPGDVDTRRDRLGSFDLKLEMTKSRGTNADDDDDDGYNYNRDDWDVDYDGDYDGDGDGDGGYDYDYGDDYGDYGNGDDDYTDDQYDYNNYTDDYTDVYDDYDDYDDYSDDYRDDYDYDGDYDY
ncbi:hypothetical protein [Glycomyces sp. MUSA5-2]|uniref:hypothetical protein n=1 Tax=Glycomyces sp. MUSA5-2 TaxID=2053002 RepID=UPI00300B981E